MRTDTVCQQHVARVPERAKLLLQLDEHLRRAEPRIRRVVADEQDAHGDQSATAGNGGQLDLRRR